MEQSALTVGEKHREERQTVKREAAAILILNWGPDSPGEKGALWLQGRVTWAGTWVSLRVPPCFGYPRTQVPRRARTAKESKRQYVLHDFCKIHTQNFKTFSSSNSAHPGHPRPN